MIDLKRKFTIVEGVYSQEIGEETVLLDMNGEEYFGLNEVGTMIWQLLQKKNDLAEILNQLVNAFDSDSKTIANDLSNLISDLVKSGLIKEQSGLD